MRPSVERDIAITASIGSRLDIHSFNCMPLPWVMDALRPSKELLSQTLNDSSKQWSSYLRVANSTNVLPRLCADLRNILRKTPSFLGWNLLPENPRSAVYCVEKNSGLLVAGSSTWAVSQGRCYLEPISIPADILLAVPDPLTVHISDSAPLAEWPGIDGLEQEEGNYIAVLFLAWAYILSMRWAELLEQSPEHRCTSNFERKDCPASPDQQCEVEIDIGSDVDIDEAAWWEGIFVFSLKLADHNSI